jgi:(p)ppGpp synthase/HD superfamily hydrolase
MNPKEINEAKQLSKGMERTSIVEKARAFATERHAGQFRRDGVTPYITHCEKVASLVESDLEKSVAYCHDLIEDGKATPNDISGNVNAHVAVCCAHLTHKKDETYEKYINRIWGDFNRADSDFYVIIRVKIADIVANLSDSPSPKQIEKYNKALRILAGV